MLTDVFLRRYKDKVLWTKYDEQDRVFWYQIASLVVTELLPSSPLQRDEGLKYPSIKEMVRRTTMELGERNLPQDQEYAWGYKSNSLYHESVWTFLRMPPPQSFNEIDKFVKYKVSFVELAFRMVGEQREAPPVAAEVPEQKFRLFFRSRPLVKQVTGDNGHAKFQNHVAELNQRFLQAQYPLSYNNGYIQLKHAGLVTETIYDPFWKLVEGPEWQNVSVNMAEALDLRDNGGLNPSLYAAKALESLIKIVSDKKGWTRGSEKGASNFIDNLASQANGRFLEPWEADALRHFFSKIRNPLAHGSGTVEMPKLTAQQDDWAIETCISWIKSLIARI